MGVRELVDEEKTFIELVEEESIVGTCAMVETRVQLALRMLRSTLGLGDGSPLELAMAKASLLDVSLWMSLGDAQLAALTYPDGGVDRTLKLGHYLYLKVYQVFVVHRRANC